MNEFCIYIAHFLCEYIQMRFTTLCGGLCQTALWCSSQSFFLNVTSRIFRCPQNRMSDARPQHRELHALLFLTSVWVLFFFFFLFSYLTCHTTMLILLPVFPLVETISSEIRERLLPWQVNCSLLLSFCASKVPSIISGWNHVH